jgi:hypothetical protein
MVDETEMKNPLAAVLSMTIITVVMMFSEDERCFTSYAVQKCIQIRNTLFEKLELEWLLVTEETNVLIFLMPICYVSFALQKFSE